MFPKARYHSTTSDGQSELVVWKDRNFWLADKLPRIARTDICRGIIAQFYISDFWNATRALWSYLPAWRRGMGDPGET